MLLSFPDCAIFLVFVYFLFFLFFAFFIGNVITEIRVYINLQFSMASNFRFYSFVRMNQVYILFKLITSKLGTMNPCKSTKRDYVNNYKSIIGMLEL